MTDTTTVAVIGLVGVAVGAGLTIAGGLLRDWFSRGDKKRDLMRVRLEEIYQTCCEIERWCGEYAGFVLVAAGPPRPDNDAPSGHAPIERLDSLVAIYQPELAFYSDKVREADDDFTRGCVKWMLDRKTADDYQPMVHEPLRQVRSACKQLKEQACAVARDRYL